MGKNQKTRLTFAARATKYAQDIVTRKVDACLYVRQACQRHLDNLEMSGDSAYPYRFDEHAADKICRFAENMVHIKGEWTGTKIKLEAWQVFFFSCIWGWLQKADSLRRFREVYAEIPRINTKSTMGAIGGNFMAFADNEPGAEVYSGASTEKQAFEVFGPARLMVLNNPEFQQHFGIYVGAKNLSHLDIKSGTKFEPIIGKPGYGAKAHFAIEDELHEHKTSELHDTMLTGMGNRRQPMIFGITTAGTDTSGPCYAKRDEAVKILSGAMENDKFFAIIYTIDEGDDWTKQSMWRKANPNYGVSIKEEFLEARRKEAIAIAGKQNLLKCMHLNIWSAAGSAWINMETWKANRRNIKMSDFEGMPCWVGIDLAQKIDLTAMMFLFRWGDTFFLFGKYYLPEDTIALPENDHYRRWVAEGHMIATPGARTDYQYLMDDLLEWNKKLIIKELAYDPRESEMLMQMIRPQVSFECVEIQQTAANLSEPMKEFEALYVSNRLLHDGDPVLTWQAANVVRKSSKTKYYYPARERDANKIDGIVAAIMALLRAMAAEEEPSVYEGRDLLVLGE